MSGYAKIALLLAGLGDILPELPPPVPVLRAEIEAVETELEIVFARLDELYSRSASLHHDLLMREIFEEFLLEGYPQIIQEEFQRLTAPSNRETER